MQDVQHHLNQLEAEQEKVLVVLELTEGLEEVQENHQTPEVLVTYHL